MGHNEVFRVFDNGGETVDRYTVFLVDDPGQGALGLSDDPTNPSYGFSQFGDFDLETVASNNNEIPFNSLPDKVQAHVLDRFGLTEDEVNPMMDAVLAAISGNNDSVKSALNSIVENKIQSLMEFRNSTIKFTGDDVLINGTKVGEIHVDLDNHDEGIVLTLKGGEKHSFDTVEELTKFLADKFRISESSMILAEATLKQKAVVKALRQLARKLQIPKPRFRSSGGRTEFIELSLRDWKEEQLPNDLRKKAVVKVMNVVPLNFSNVVHGNIRPESMAMTADQWTQLLSHYGIDVPELMGEGYTTMPPIDRDRYPDREDQGLEGPFTARNGKVVYYDKKEGKYYDPDSDMYISYDEWEEMDRPADMVREGLDLVGILTRAAKSDNWKEILSDIPEEYREYAVKELPKVWNGFKNDDSLSRAKKGRLYRKVHAMEDYLHLA